MQQAVLRCSFATADANEESVYWLGTLFSLQFKYLNCPQS